MCSTVVTRLRAGQGPANEDDGVGQLHQLHEDLAHVVDQGHHVAAEEHAALHLPGAQGENGDDGQVDHHIGQGVHQRGNAAHEELHLGQGLVKAFKAGRLLLLPGKGPDHPDAERFSRVAPSTRSARSAPAGRAAR